MNLSYQIEKVVKKHLAGSLIKIIIVTGILYGITAVIVPNALRSSALAATFPIAAVLGLASVGETLVIQQRGLDLSVPGTMALSAYLAASLPSDHFSTIGALFIVALVAGVIGCVNGALVTVGRITPLVATLAVGGLLEGVLLTVSGTAPANATGTLARLGSYKLGGVTELLWISIAITLIVGAWVRGTTFGRRFVGVGASPAAGRVAGLVVNRYVVLSYVVGSLCYAGAGVLLVSYVGTTSTSMGNPYELAVIAAVIIGGTPLEGGRGSVVATWVAALLLAELDQIVVTLGAPNSTQLLIQSLVIAAAASLARLRIGRLSGWRRIPKGAV